MGKNQNGSQNGILCPKMGLKIKNDKLPTKIEKIKNLQTKFRKS